MKFSKQDLLTMLIGLFLFSSCKDPNTIGLGQEDSAITGELYDNTTITSQTQADDAVSASQLTTGYPIGFMTDPVFGETTAGTAMTVNIPSEKYRFGKNAILDSAVLILPYSSQATVTGSKTTYFYGDSTQTYTFTVGQMTKDLTREQSFLSSTEWGKDATEVLGTLVTNDPNQPQGRIFIKPSTPFKITEIVTGKPDSLRMTAPQLRIRLNTAKIQDKIVKMDTLSLDRNNLFIDKFRGLYVGAKATGKGGIIFFNSVDSARLQLYYKKDGKTQGTRDTVSINFPIKPGLAPVVSYVKHDYANTPIKTQLEDHTGKQYEETYLQALSGLRNKISFNFDDFKTKMGGAKVAVNKAELVIDVSPTADAHFKPAPRLRLYRYDVAEKRQNISDNNPPSESNPSGDPRATTELLFGGFFDSVNSRYIFTVTSYVQDLINGKIKDYGTFIAPTPITAFTLTPYASSAERSILLSPKKDAAAGTKRMKLNIFYTKLK
ncbi:DUF4270 domain-containing protein [Pedobacter steynii]|uniref:DUF4270 domain-containing protein n=1 Tax=Pedobacter steynii TaxID=430522 RepID=A0A1D7QFV5_9SPHI|nr:DUF4270 domain-containing protein [Pedobacter steynii]AOM77576.1 hypothetical protein BFS30_10595 [Pedobacter steynii]